MISVRRALERHRVRRPEPDAWLTFYPQSDADPLAASFGSRLSLKEIWLPAGVAASVEPHVDGELLTYVRDGNFAHVDSSGDAGVIRAGEFHLLAVSCGASRRELNDSKTESAQVYQLCLRRPVAPIGVRHAQQARFSVAQRRGQLCLVASPDARNGSLQLRQDASVYSALLERGQHVVHALSSGRSAWLHLVHGAVAVGDVTLNAGDGAGINGQPALSITPREDSEILLVDMPEARAGSTNGQD